MQPEDDGGTLYDGESELNYTVKGLWEGKLRAKGDATVGDLERALKRKAGLSKDKPILLQYKALQLSVREMTCEQVGFERQNVLFVLNGVLVACLIVFAHTSV